MIRLIRHIRTKLLIRRARRWAGKYGPPVISTGWQAWKLSDDRLDAARHAVAAFEQRHTPEALAIVRAVRGAHPYQRCLKANGCQHPCSCPIRRTEPKEK